MIFTKQCDNRWGSIKLVETEFVLFEIARSYGTYKYYHLLSGVCLPIKNQDYIHNVCDKLYGKEFVGYEKEDMQTICNLRKKLKYYYIFQRHFRKDNTVIGGIIEFVQKMFLEIQKCVGINREYTMEIKKGCNWVSITNDFVEYLLRKKTDVLHIFNHTLCPDEIFLQTILWNSPYRKNIYDYNDEYHSCLRKIDWVRGYPYVWKKEDFDELMNDGNECFFARKFSSQEKALIDAIVERLRK